MRRGRATWLQQAAATLICAQCPRCGVKVAPEGFQVGQGTTRCQACGHTFTLVPQDPQDAVTAAMESWSPDAEAPPAPRKLRVHLADDGRRLTLEHPTGNRGLGCFLLFWMAGWSTGCFYLAQSILREPRAFTILFAIPFFAAWVAVAAMLVNILFGRERLTLGPDGILHQTRALVSLRSRLTGIDEIRWVRGFSRVVDSESGERAQGIELVTLGNPIQFGVGLTDQERLWVADILRRGLERLAVRLEAPAVGTKNMPGVQPSPGLVTIAESVHPPASRPSDSSFRLERGGDGLTLACRPAFAEWLPAFLVLTFVNLFWNSIVAALGIVTVREAPRAVLLFLVPFAALGLFLFWLWVKALFVPLTTHTWTFRPGEVRTETTVFGLGTVRRLPLHGLAHLEMRGQAYARNSFGTRSAPESPRYSLALVATDGSEPLSIPDLTEGEARWIADELLRAGL